MCEICGSRFKHQQREGAVRAVMVHIGRCHPEAATGGDAVCCQHCGQLLAADTLEALIAEHHYESDAADDDLSSADDAHAMDGDSMLGDDGDEGLGAAGGTEGENEHADYDHDGGGYNSSESLHSSDRSMSMQAEHDDASSFTSTEYDDAAAAS